MPGKKAGTQRSCDGGGSITTGNSGGWEDHGLQAGHDLEELCHYALEQLNARFVSVWRQALSTDLISLYAVAQAGEAGHSPQLRERWNYVPLADLPPLARALTEGTAVHVSEVRTESGRIAELATDFGVRSLGFHPLLRGGDALGAFAVEPAQAALADLLALRALVGAAAANLALLQADRRRAELELFLRLGEVSVAGSLGQILALGCEGLAQLLGVRRASVFVVQDGELIPRMSRMADGSTDLVAWELFRGSPPLPLACQVLLSGGAVEAHDPSSPLLGAWWTKTFGIAAMLGVPIVNCGEVLGVLAVDADRPRGFSADHLRLAVGAATQLGWVMTRTHAHQALAHQATHDDLTGLLNRAALLDYLPQALARAARSGEELTVAFLDLDGFKQVNDTLGHRRGDLVLTELARRLKAGQRDGDIVARLGGDEFAVVLHRSGPSGAEAVATRIAGLLAAPLDLDGHTAQVGVSIGLACFPTHAVDDGELMERADTAMYQAKRTHRQFELYRPGDQDSPPK